MTVSPQRFPFGAPVLPCGDSTPDQVDAFVLGAYPSAVHVRWVPPKETGLKPISALAVDNEPTVFWDGIDAEARVEQWRDRYFDPRWGSVTTARLNGPSGAWLQSQILKPLGAAGAVNHFVTDCLTTYRLSAGAATRLSDTYEPMIRQTESLAPVDLLRHPSESEIVKEALREQAGRLKSQIAAANPSVVVTLGNAASRVVNDLSGGQGAGKLEADNYGSPRTIDLAGLRTTWIALVHPATPARWQRRHQEWLDQPGFNWAS